MTAYAVAGIIYYRPGPGMELLDAFRTEEPAEECRDRYEEAGSRGRNEDTELSSGHTAHFYDSFQVVEVPLNAVTLTPAKAREIADHLADYDITARLSNKEDDRPQEAVEWSRTLRRRANDAREDDGEREEE